MANNRMILLCALVAIIGSILVVSAVELSLEDGDPEDIEEFKSVSRQKRRRPEEQRKRLKGEWKQPEKEVLSLLFSSRLKLQILPGKLVGEMLTTMHEKNVRITGYEDLSMESLLNRSLGRDCVLSAISVGHPEDLCELRLMWNLNRFLQADDERAKLSCVREIAAYYNIEHVKQVIAEGYITIPELGQVHRSINIQDFPETTITKEEQEPWNTVWAE